MLLYLDSSALLKRVLDEAYTDNLRDWVVEQQDAGHELITSTVGWVEVTRILMRSPVQLEGFTIAELETLTLSGVSACPLSYEIVALARRIGPSELRSLDAIHCASAMLLDVEQFVSYDVRQAAAASDNSLKVVSPGLEHLA